jgi:hypothetical protein
MIVKMRLPGCARLMALSTQQLAVAYEGARIN